MKAKRKSLFRRLVGWIRNLILAFFVLSLLAVVLYKYMPVYVTPLMLLRVGEQCGGERMPVWNTDGCL